MSNQNNALVGFRRFGFPSLCTKIICSSSLWQMFLHKLARGMWSDGRLRLKWLFLPFASQAIPPINSICSCKMEPWTNTFNMKTAPLLRCLILPRRFVQDGRKLPQGADCDGEPFLMLDPTAYIFAELGGSPHLVSLKNPCDRVW